MAMPCSSAAAITSSSRIEPPGWITAVAPASIAEINPSAKGKKAPTRPPSLGQRFRQARRLCGILGLARSDARGIDPAHLAGADAHRRPVLGIDDGVGLHMLGDGEGKGRSASSAARGRALGHDLQVQISRPRRCRATAPACRPRPLHHRPGDARVRQAAGEQQAQVLLAGDDRLRLGRRIRRDDHLGENLDDLRRRFGIERAVRSRRCRRRPRRDRRAAPCR